ncbi:MAG: CapA family protein [Actinomycetota bacterium]|nr:CapA family protein [Actinomycetota bacterium]
MRATVRVGWRVGAAGAVTLLLASCGADAVPQGGETALGVDSPVAVQPTSPPREFTMVATGDPLIHEDFWYQAMADAAVTGNGDMDYYPLMANVAAITSDADYAVCHMETVVAPRGGPYSGYPVFSVPPQIIDAKAQMGYDLCTTASNHTFDDGAEGIDRTLGELDAAGIAHAGSARTPQEAATPTIVEVQTEQGAVKVGHLNYTFGFNGIPAPNGEIWRGNKIDVPAIKAEAARAKAAGAEVVILTMHWGTEYQTEPDADQIAQAQELMASPDIDHIIGGHVHVVQPITKINDKWVTYGHGNLFACHRDWGQPNEEGLLTRFTFTEQPGGGFTSTKAEYLPLLSTCTFDGPTRVMNIPKAFETGDFGAYGQDRLQLAWDRTTATVNSMGAEAQGLQLLEQ